MSIRKRLILLLVAATALALIVLAGCMGEMSAEEFLKQEGAVGQYVVYYANGGTFDGKDNRTTKTLHYKPDSYILYDFDAAQVKIERTDFVFDGWQEIVLGTDGKPVLDADGNVTLTGTPFDFNKKLGAGEVWYLGAVWVPNIKLDVILATSDGGDMTSADGTVYKSGDVIKSFNFYNGAVTINTNTPVNSNGYTFTQYFYDEACTQRVLSNFTFPEGEVTENPVIYAQYLKGTWTVVRSSNDVRRMLNNEGSNYWICSMTEEKVIDCSSLSVPLRRGLFSANIEGNGFTLKGITVKATLDTANETYSMFGQLGANSAIKDLTFEDLTVEATTPRAVSVYLISGSADGATLENVTFKNAKLVVSGETINNIPKVTDGYVTNNWLVGGFESDGQFLTEYTGVKIEGATLEINKNEFTFGN